MLTKEQLITVDEFEKIIARPENLHRRLELINGEIEERVPTEKHGEIIITIGGELYIFLRKNPIGRATTDARHRVAGDEHNDRRPDISVRLDVERPAVEHGAVSGLPEFIIEVQSPSDSLKRMQSRADYYLANGTKLVWLVYPAKQIVEVLTPADRQLLTIEDTLTGGDVLPEFSLPVKTIFA